ncbi:MAG TPA: hypothetical protein VNS63_21705 [Blastocatellia bacterium]|nr:hypothetical protein [Blastocatellia bacterium]
MNSITRRSISLAATIALALSAFALAATRAEASSKYYTITGKVLKIDAKARTLLVADRLSERTYLVTVPKGVTLKITWGRSMGMEEPGFTDVYNNDRVQIRCIRPEREQHATLDDGRSAITVTAASGK